VSGIGANDDDDVYILQHFLVSHRQQFDHFQVSRILNLYGIPLTCGNNIYISTIFQNYLKNSYITPWGK
jgi:hypothetical protein